MRDRERFYKKKKKKVNPPHQEDITITVCTKLLLSCKICEIKPERTEWKKLTNPQLQLETLIPFSQLHLENQQFRRAYQYH